MRAQVVVDEFDEFSARKGGDRGGDGFEHVHFEPSLHQADHISISRYDVPVSQAGQSESW